MKIRILLLALFIVSNVFSQVSVSSQHIGGVKGFKKGFLDKFKKTETIFVLSTLYEIEEYQKILDEVWTVTPFRIIDAEEFEIREFLGSKYSVAQLSGIKKEVQMKSGSTVPVVNTYFDLKMYNKAMIQKKLSKLSPKKRKEKRSEIMEMYSSDIARFLLYPKEEFITEIYKDTKQNDNMAYIVDALFHRDVFFNNKLGFIKNYFQKINNLLETEEVNWMYGDSYINEIANLTNETLYIPSYVLYKYNGRKRTDNLQDESYLDELFKDYVYDYELIDDNVLNDKILSGEEFYYLRYARSNSERFIQIINSKTGEIVYADHIIGMSYNIKDKHIKDLVKCVTKVDKKMNR